MNKSVEKLRYIYFPFLIALVSTIIVLGFLRWIIEVKMRLPIEETIFIAIIPVIFSAILLFTVLRKRIYLLKIKGRKGKGYIKYQFFAWLVFLGSLGLSQFLVGTMSYDLIEVDDVNRIDKSNPSRYYRIKHITVDKLNPLVYSDVSTSGRFKEQLNFRMFIVCSIKNNDENNNFFWYGKRYNDQINNRGSESDKQKAYERFWLASKTKYSNWKFLRPEYYENINYSSARTGYVNAIKKRFSIEDKKLFIFEPVYTPFLDRYNDALTWFFIFFGFGSFVFLIMVLYQPINETNLGLFKNRAFHLENEFGAFLKYLIPKKPHIQTSVIIDLNLLFFLYAVFSGVNFLSPNVSDLIKFGAINRDLFYGGDYWRVISAQFIHIGFLHLINNIFALGICGFLLEKYLRGYWFSIAYLLTGIIALLFSFIWLTDVCSAGASGGIFGLYGIMITLLIRRVLPIESKAIYMVFLVFFAGVSMVIGFLLPFVNNAAHIGGLISGFAIGYIIPIKTVSNAAIDSDITLN